MAKTEFQKRAQRNVDANKKGYVTGPKGGADTATRIGSKPPPTSGGSRKSKPKPPTTAPANKKKSAIQQGVDAIRESGNRSIDYDKGKMGQ